MMSKSKLLDILERTVSQNPADCCFPDQQQVLEYLRHASSKDNKDYAVFVRNLASLLSEVQNVSFVRQAAGLQLKNTLAEEDEMEDGEVREDHRPRWLSLPDGVCLYVKECVVKALGSEARPSAAAQCIAAIATIELPLNKWPDLIDSLMGNVTNVANPEVLREASLEALGYVCLDVPPLVLETKSGAILTAIVQGMRVGESSPQIRLAAANALLEFSHQNFDNEAHRIVIMEMMCTAIQAADAEKVKIVALQCLAEIMSLCYSLMACHMEELIRITVHAMKDDAEGVVLQGIEFWSNVCDVELELRAEAEESEERGEPADCVSKDYAKQALPHILPILTECLAKQDDDVDEDEWVPSKAAGVCIMLLAQCCGDVVVDEIHTFIYKHFTSSDWQHRKAAIMAFGSILEGPSKEKLAISQAIPSLISALGDPHQAVRDTAAWAIGRICDACGEFVTREDVVKALLPSLFTVLYDQPRVAANGCWAISSLAKATAHHDVAGTSVLSPYFENMVAELIKATERNDARTSNLRIAAYEALRELMRNSPADCYPIVQRTTMSVLQKLESLFGAEDALVAAAPSTDRSQLRDFQSQWCTTLQSVLQKIRKEDAPLISDAIMAGLLKIMSRCFERDGGAVIDEALMAITTLIGLIGASFDKYIESFKPYLFHALDSHQDSQMCLAALGVVSELCRAFCSKIDPLADELMARLFSLLEDPGVKREVKSQVLNCFGDVAIAMGSAFKRHLSYTLKWLSDAVLASPISNPDTDYVEGLRKNCCTAFAAIVQVLCGSDGVGGDEEGKIRARFAKIIKQLIVQVASAEDPRSAESLCASALSLVGYFLISFESEAIALYETDAVASLLERCRRSKDPKTKEIPKWVERVATRLKSSMQEPMDFS